MNLAARVIGTQIDRIVGYGSNFCLDCIKSARQLKPGEFNRSTQHYSPKLSGVGLKQFHH